jgi:lysophospholipase L1-like esterase
MAGGFPFRSAQASGLDAAVLLRDGYQVTNTSITGDNTLGGFAVGDALGGIGPAIGHSIYIESITLQSLIDVFIWIQRADASLIANGAASGLMPVAVGPTYGSPVVPLGTLLKEGESLSFVLRTAVPSGGGSNTFSFRAGFVGRRFTNDFSFESPNTMLVIGDSITNGTGPDYGLQLYHARVQRFLKFNGSQYRRIVKGDGGWKTSHAVDAMQRGWFDVSDPGLIMVMLGTNETVIADFQTNMTELISWMQEVFPSVKKCIIGPPPRQDSIETTVLVPIRSWTESYVAGLGDPNIHFTSLADSFDRTIASNYIASDGPDGTRIHPTGIVHGVMADYLFNEWEVSGFLSEIP